MRNIGDNVYIPNEGYKYVSNGDVFANQIMLGAGDSVDNWHDTNAEPPAPPDPEDEATAEDYEAALNRLGVET